jgi:hypothetical protein
LVLSSVAALAVAGDRAIPAALKRLIDCRSVTADPERLACYDSAVAQLTGVLDKGEVVALDKQQVTTARRQAFGFHLPSLSMFDTSGQPELDRISATVKDAHQRADGTWVIELEDGAVWSQIPDDEHLSRYPHRGSKVEIRKASLGTFFINIDGQRAIRAKRTD